MNKLLLWAAVVMFVILAMPTSILADSSYPVPNLPKNVTVP